MIRVPPSPALALLPLDRHELAACLEAMLLRAGRLCELELICLRDADIARLNADCLGCAGPTNILAWPDGQAGAAGIPPGEKTKKTPATLVMSVDAVRREASLYGQEPAAYCRSLLAHGLAHALGHDHGRGMDDLCARMLNCEG